MPSYFGVFVMWQAFKAVNRSLLDETLFAIETGASEVSVWTF